MARLAIGCQAHLNYSDGVVNEFDKAIVNLKGVRPRASGEGAEGLAKADRTEGMVRSCIGRRASAWQSSNSFTAQRCWPARVGCGAWPLPIRVCGQSRDGDQEPRHRQWADRRMDEMLMDRSGP